MKEKTFDVCSVCNVFRCDHDDYFDHKFEMVV